LYADTEDRDKHCKNCTQCEKDCMGEEMASQGKDIIPPMWA